MAKPEPADLVFIKVINLRLWAPLSRTKKLEIFWDNFTRDQELEMRKQFALFLGRLLIVQAKKAIATQQFPVRYTALSERYLKWKARNKRNLGFWISSSYLIDHLNAWYSKKEDAVYVGFNARTRHPDNGTRLVIIAAALEKGVKENNLPPRPLFTPLARGIEKSILRHFRKFLKEKHHKFLPLFDASIQ